MRAACLAVLAFASLASAAEPIPPADGKAPRVPFKFPAARTPNAPPVTAPGDVLQFTGDALYVIPHDEPFLLFVASPGKPSPVTVTRETGPLKIRGKFLDGTGQVETRTFAAKHLAIVEPIPGMSGVAELIAIPAGTVDEKNAARQLVDVNHGAKPPPKDDEKKDKIEPPKPVPPDIPPEPKPKPITTGPLYLILVEELDERTLATANLVNNTAFWKRMEARKVFFRPYDKDEWQAANVDPKTAKRVKSYVDEVARRNLALPALLILDEDGDVIQAVPRPKDVAAVEALVREVSP